MSYILFLSELSVEKGQRRQCGSAQPSNDDENNVDAVDDDKSETCEEGVTVLSNAAEGMLGGGDEEGGGGEIGRVKCGGSDVVTLVQ